MNFRPARLSFCAFLYLVAIPIAISITRQPFAILSWAAVPPSIVALLFAAHCLRTKKLHMAALFTALWLVGAALCLVSTAFFVYNRDATKHHTTLEMP